MRNKVVTMWGGLVIATSLVCSPGALAHRSISGDERGNLDELTEQAELVAVGTVSSVEYVLTESEEGEIPYTIVTYNIGEKIRGNLKKSTNAANDAGSGETLTLKFVGGADGKGGFMSVSGVPQFQEGEEDILFVKGNGEDDRCPLVNCAYGRYRLHKNQVFNTHGQPVRGLVKNNAVARGKRDKAFETFSFPTPAFDDLLKNPEAKKIIEAQGQDLKAVRQRYEAEKPEKITVKLNPMSDQANDSAGTDPEAKGRPAGGKENAVIGMGPVSKSAMLAKIKEINGKSRRKPDGVASADASRKVVSHPIQSKAPRDSGDSEAQPQGAPEDLDEIRALQAQDGNPVLKRDR